MSARTLTALAAASLALAAGGCAQAPVDNARALHPHGMLPDVNDLAGARDTAREFCAAYPLAKLASIEHVDEPDANAVTVALAYASHSAPAWRPAATAGCTAGIKARR